MSEKVEQLKATLGELTDELHSIESLDAETRNLLEGTVEEIHTALSESDSAELEDRSIAERLKETAQSFEESHPTLSRIVGSIVDALGEIGI